MTSTQKDYIEDESMPLSKEERIANVKRGYDPANDYNSTKYNYTRGFRNVPSDEYFQYHDSDRALKDALEDYRKSKINNMKELTIKLTQDGKEDIVRNTTFTKQLVETMGEERILRFAFDSFVKEIVTPEITTFNMGNIHISVNNPNNFPPEDLLDMVIEKATSLKEGIFSNLVSYVELTPNEQKETLD